MEVERSSGLTAQQRANEERAKLSVCYCWTSADVLASSNPDRRSVCRRKRVFPTCNGEFGSTVRMNCCLVALVFGEPYTGSYLTLGANLMTAARLQQPALALTS